MDGFVRESTLGRPRARRWAAFAAASAIFGCGFAVGAEPSLRAANRYIAAGQIDLAKAELAAIGSSDEARLADTWANLHLAEVARSDEIAAVVQGTEQIPEHTRQRVSATRHAYEVVSRVAQRELAAGKPDGAEAALVEAAPLFRDAGEEQSLAAQIAELRARAQDEAFDKCADDACRWNAANQAARLASSPTRTQRVAAARGSLMNALSIQEAPNESMVSRLARLRSQGELAKKVEALQTDAELAAKARATDAWVGAERGKVKLIGADRAVVEDLLGALEAIDDSTARATISGVMVFVSLRNGRCAGLYLTGDRKGARALNGPAHGEVTARILSQAVGRPLATPDPPARTGRSQVVTNYKEGGVSIVARWHGTELVELRIGDAKP